MYSTCDFSFLLLFLSPWLQEYVQTDSGLLPIRRAVGGAKYLPTASWVLGISAHSQPGLGWAWAWALALGFLALSSKRKAFLHNLGLLLIADPLPRFKVALKWRRKKLVNTGSHRTVLCIRLQAWACAVEWKYFMKLLLCKREYLRLVG